MFSYPVQLLFSLSLLALSSGQTNKGGYGPAVGDGFCSCAYRPVDCSEVLRCGQTKSGIYQVWPWSRLLPDSSPISVLCDMDFFDGGWTVIQRRGDYGRPNDYFFRDWISYKFGFGSLQTDFWLGNDKISALTNQRVYSIAFELTDLEGEVRYAFYDQFSVDNENNNYTLRVEGYSGNAGDSFSVHNAMQFSTKDRDNDVWSKNCALSFKGSWWYKVCHRSNLNGLYLKGFHSTYADGIEWATWKGLNYSLFRTEMKIRVQNFNPNLRCYPRNSCSLGGG